VMEVLPAPDGAVKIITFLFNSDIGLN
jgi:hypothetical protein